MEKEEKKQNEISRRGLLKTGAVLAGSVIVSGGVFGALSLKSNAAVEETKQTPEYPWPYVQLDVERAKVLGYEGYFKKQCCYGAFDAVMQQLREKIGYPYTVVPSEIMIWGGTGGAGWATLCGALIGASTAINFVVGPSNKEVFPIVEELYDWYCKYPFPGYKPPMGKAGKVEGDLPTIACGSPLCHVSVSVWCDASKYRAESNERSERCGRLTADVAGKTVELLNAYHSKKFVPLYEPSEVVGGCMSCHGKGSTLENTRGKMECSQCHDDIDPTNLMDHIKQQWDFLK